LSLAELDPKKSIPWQPEPEIAIVQKLQIATLLSQR
jgi:hypothetical protein